MELQSLNIRKSSPIFEDITVTSDKDGKLVVTDNDAFTKDGKFNHLDIDPLPGKVRNECGFVMNDIMAFESAQSDSFARTILQNMKIRKGDGVPVDKVFKDDNGTLSDDAKSLFDSIVPSNWSSPSEYVRAQKMLAKISFEKYQRRQAKLQKENEEKIRFASDDNPKVD